MTFLARRFNPSETIANRERISLVEVLDAGQHGAGPAHQMEPRLVAQQGRALAQRGLVAATDDAHAAAGDVVGEEAADGRVGACVIDPNRAPKRRGTAAQRHRRWQARPLDPGVTIEQEELAQRLAEAALAAQTHDARARR